MRSRNLLLAVAAGIVAEASYFKYSTDQTGFFIQENPSENASPPDYVCNLAAAYSHI